MMRYILLSFLLISAVPSIVSMETQPESEFLKYNVHPRKKRKLSHRTTPLRKYTPKTQPNIIQNQSYLFTKLVMMVGLSAAVVLLYMRCVLYK